jgi:hypothetical protein
MDYRNTSGVAGEKTNQDIAIATVRVPTGRSKQ